MSAPKERVPALTCKAYAKVNLTLEILGRRSDGYHEVATVMQTLELHDTLTFSPSTDLALESNWPELAAPDNLVLRAARELQAKGSTKNGASIFLEKRIPLAAGLGGGSSDAACALRTLNELWQLSLPPGELVDIGARLGSDVPFFFHLGTALAQGRGEIVAPLPPFPPRWLVLVCPRVQIPEKTRLLYSRIKPEHYSNGAATAHVVDALRQGREVDEAQLPNVFLPILLSENAAVRTCHAQMSELGVSPVLLSGAGPTLFTLARSEAEARSICESLAGLDADVILTRTTSRST